MAVLFYHLGVVLPGGAIERFAGGFVGVDVFFVISGYLITGIIKSRLETGTFSIGEFYERRARRILPALFAMMVATSILAYRYWFPAELADFGKSAVAASLSVSNFYFWSTAGYFSAPAETKLLLHTWSLAVEEQFYIVWPLLLMAAARLSGKRFATLIVVVSALSFAISVAGVAWWPDSAFYLVFGRAWELLLGGGLTLDVFRRPARRLPRELATAAGLAAICAAVLAYKPTMAFPGAAALLPCGGAALVIFGGIGGATTVGRLLSLRPVVFVGLISYSLYLWHWPVMVLAKSAALLPGGDLGWQAKFQVIGLSFALATLSWWFVERPFRRVPAPRRSVFAVSIAACLALLVTGVVQSGGLPARYTSSEIQIANFLNYAPAEEAISRCQLPHKGWATDAAFAECLPDVQGKPTVLLLGDSHATHLGPGLMAEYPGVNLLQVTGMNCKPSPEAVRQGGMCGSLLEYVRAKVLPARRPSTVLLAGRWEDANLPNLSRVIDEFRSGGMHVVLFGPIVQYDQALPRLLANAGRADSPSLVGEHRLKFDRLDGIMAAMARQHGADYVSLLHVLCPGDMCLTTLPSGNPVQFDYGHLTTEGSNAVAARLRQSGTLGALDGLVRHARN